MPSLISDFENDIFISYRQKDNEYDNWISQFVDHLNRELRASFKEEIAVYFDANQHDGIRESHDVNQSLSKKVKSLVLIPVISHTYCDPECFAWKNELLAFRDLANNDRFGLNISLENGNVAKRILPVRIHQIDETDKKLLEHEIGGFMRPIDFIYREPGVNRPLLPSDERKTNTEGTDYRNQINKVANALREIITSIKKVESSNEPKENSISQVKKRRNNTVTDPTKIRQSIVVLPFANLSPDAADAYISDGLTEDIIAHLSQIQSLRVISKSSAFSFRGSLKDVRSIGRELDVQYVLEGSVRKAGTRLRISAQLIDASRDENLWTERYDGTLDDIFDIQEKTALSIVDALKLKLDAGEEYKLIERLIPDTQAYLCLLRARREAFIGSGEGLDRALVELRTGAKILGENELLLQGMAEVHLQSYEYGIKADSETLHNVERLIDKILSIKPQSSISHYLKGRLERFRGYITESSFKHLKKAVELDPTNTGALVFLINTYASQAGWPSRAEDLVRQLLEIDPLTPLSNFIVGHYHWMKGQLKDAHHFIQMALDLGKDLTWMNIYLAYLYLWLDKKRSAIEILDQILHVDPNNILREWAMLLKYSIDAKPTMVRQALSDDTRKYLWNDPDTPWLIAATYAHCGLSENAYEWLEHAVDRGWINYPLFSLQDPLLESIRGHVRFQDLMANVKSTWESFEG